MSTEGRQINKSAIRNFAIEARNILIKSAVTEAGFYGITKDEIKDPIQKGRDFEVYETLTGADNRIFDSDVKRRAALVEAIRLKGFDEVMEETAYTWFNRLIAIRFMEVNNYLPFRMRVLSSDSGSLTPDIVSRSLEVDLNLTDRELEAIQKAKDENSYDEAFRLLFIKTCNELNDILPGLFEKTDDYMELLLKLPYTSDGVVRMLVDTIPESNFNVNEGGQVEIIGWLYQYYNTEPKAKAFAKKGKITKEEIPAVTQLFTPDWIVRYMVENSLGRLWVEHLLANGDSRSEQEIANDFGWKYYLPEAEQEPEVQAQLVQIRAERKSLTPEDILCIDPCQGSGHILVYLFDVLMQIYREDGYSERDAARCILERNLYGLDIDDRAYQLSYFAVLMKARQYDRMILKKHIQPHVYSIQESNTVNRNQLKYFGADMNVIERNNAMNQLTGLLDTFKDAKEYGSILNVDRCDWDLLRRFAENDRVEGQLDFEAFGVDQTQKQLIILIEIGEAMSQKYHVVTTNPPYMGGSGMNEKLSSFLRNNYLDSKSDLFAAFIEHGNTMLIRDGFNSMVTMQSWMFLSSFENMRQKMLGNYTIINLMHMDNMVLGIAFGTAVTVFRNHIISGFRGTYNQIKLNDIEDGIPRTFPVLENRFSQVSVERFKLIPGAPIAYWLTDAYYKIFENSKSLINFADIRQGMKTADNETYLRLWPEVQFNKFNPGAIDADSAEILAKKWFPYNKGGDYRRWYGNREYVVNWENNGLSVKQFPKSVIRNESYYFKEGLTWSLISSSNFGIRYTPSGAIFDGNGSSMFTKGPNLYELLGFMSSCVTVALLEVLSPTMTFEIGQLSKLPYIPAESNKVRSKVEENIRIAKDDWDSFEMSWEFKRHPLVPDITINTCVLEKQGLMTLAEYYQRWESECNQRFVKMKENEEILNQEYISLYGLDKELSANSEDKDITIHKSNIQRDIRSLISYAVGCMFGRYSLDIEGLAYAGGDWKEAYATNYKTFMPDEDAIIPITDEEYFKDDIVARFVDFIRIVYGEETLEENLKFIADALGNKGDSPRAVIRNYFLNDFYKDHCNTYSVTGSGKRPIYWLFDSGKQNGFKALIYIHRYTPDTVGLIRSVYLHNAQAAIQNSLQNSEYIISTTTSATERARETRKKDKYVKQLNELRPYYQALSHIALQRISMDLDDGVKKNYQLFQGVEVSTEGKKKQTIDLLAKI